MDAAEFHWADYLVFGISLAISSVVGIYYACVDRRKQTTEEFLMAGRSMHPVPVAFSLFVSCVSAVSFMGDPVEVYFYGGIYAMIICGYSLSALPIAHIFAPFYHRLNLTSVYELLYLGIVIYGPALAFSQVSRMPMWSVIVVIGVICTFYTTIGGMKAVLWADCIQMIIMIAGLLAALAQGLMSVGGFPEMWRLSKEGGRINFNNFSPDPLVRTSFWVALVGGFFRTFVALVGAQFCVQRYATVRTPRQATLVVYLTIPLFVIVMGIFWLLGLTMYSYYSQCDPLYSGRVRRPDQLVPLFVLDVLGFLPGIPGLYLAGVFSASLSTLSSAYNGLSATCLKDIIEPAYERAKQKRMNDVTATMVARAIAAVSGVISMALAFGFPKMGGMLMSLTFKIVGIIAGPLVGTFLLGFFVPFVDSLAAFSGFLVAMAVLLWVGIGNIIYKPRYATLPGSVAGCPRPTLNSSLMSPNTTISVTSLMSSAPSNVTSFLTTAAPPITKEASITDLYKLSPYLYTPLAVVVCFIVGITIGLISWLVFKNTASFEKYAKLHGKDRQNLSMSKRDVDYDTHKHYSKIYDHEIRYGNENGKELLKRTLLESRETNI